MLLQSPDDSRWRDSPFHEGSVDQRLRELFADGDLADGLEKTHGPDDATAAVLARTFMRVIREVADAIEGLREWSPFLFWALFVLLCLIAIALIVHMAYLAYRGLTAKAPRRPGEDEEEELRALSSKILREKARELARSGQLSEALRFLTLSLLARLDEHQVIRRAESWTNREIFARLMAKHGQSSELRAFSARIESVRYGGDAITPEEFEELDQHADRILHWAERGR